MERVVKLRILWDKYLNQDRLADPGSTTVLDKLQKDLAQVVRPLQCSLAVADLAEHLGGANLKDTLTKESLKELAQVMGVLSSESAQALLPLADHRAALFEAEKKRLREVAIKGICPLSIQMDLRQTPVFSGGLFPKKDLAEIGVRASVNNHTNFFPALKPPFKRPLTVPGYATYTSQTKKPRTEPPAHSTKDGTKPKFTTKSGRSSNLKGSKAGKKKKRNSSTPFRRRVEKPADTKVTPSSGKALGKTTQVQALKPKST